MASFRVFRAFRVFRGLHPVNGGDDTDEKVEANAIAGLQARCNRLAADARYARLVVWLIGERVMHVVGQLPVDAHRLKTMEDGVA